MIGERLDYSPPLERSELRELLLGDGGNVVAALEDTARRALQWWQDYFAAWGDEASNSRYPTEEAAAGAEVEAVFEQFTTVYYNDDGTPQEEAFVALARALWDRFQIVTAADMVNVAAKVVNDTPDGEVIQLYVPGYNAASDLATEETYSSVPFMAKLVRAVAARRGTTVEIVSDFDLHLVQGRLVLVDDAAYSGTKIADEVQGALLSCGPTVHIDLHLAAARRQGIKTIQQYVPDGCSLSVFVGAELYSFAEMFADDPAMLSYFLANAIRSSGRLSYPQITLGAAERQLSEHGPAITQYRTPDGFCLPLYIAACLPGGDGRREYPTTSEIAALLESTL